MGFAPEELTDDGFLGGRVHCHQPRHGFRSGTDAVFLAASIAAKPGQKVLELGCGAGVALCCLGARVEGLNLTGVEVQPAYTDLAGKNLARTGQTGRIIAGDVTAPSAELRALEVDHAFFNPPYHSEGGSTAPIDPGRDVAHRAGEGLLAAFLDQGIRRVRPGGWINMILPTAATQAALTHLGPRVGDLRLLPIAARVGRGADRVIIAARKGARAPLTLLPPFVVHDGAAHISDKEDYSDRARSVLREGAALPLSAGF